MNYSELSDFEINMAVAHLLGATVETSSNLTACFKPDFEVSVLSPGGPVSKFDPCNSWSDAGPIIQKNNISILIDDTTKKWSSASVQDFTNVSAYKFGNCHENPLRAAMIVFLMMQEKK